MAKGVGLHEDRTRVVFHLPLNDIKEEHAVNKIVDFLKEQREREDTEVTGFTDSVFRPAVFRGWWRSRFSAEWTQDHIVMLMIDFKLDFGDQRLSEKVKELKKTIRHWYRHFGKPQEEIWVVAHQITRFD